MRNYFYINLFVLFLGSINPTFASVDDQDMEAAVRMYDPFTKLPKAVDPITQKPYQYVIAGPSFLAPKNAPFSYYRYVTFYNVKESKERIHSLPVLREECYDNSVGFGSYSFSYTFTSSISVGMKTEVLGLEGSLSESRTVNTGRNLQASGGIIADHIPYFLKQDWIGKTYVQVYHADTGKTGIVIKINGDSSRYYRMMTGGLPYPFGFEVQDADWIFAVERKIISTCN